MKKKVFFVVGLFASAVAASFFIPLQNGEYWWATNSDWPEVVIVDGDRIPAGGPQNGPAYEPPDEDLTYVDPNYQEETPVYSGGKDAKPEAPANETHVHDVPVPAQAPAPPKISCIKAALTEPSQRPTGQKFGSNNWIRNMHLSNAYIDSFIRSASKKGGTNPQTLRAAITSIIAAGYCSGKDYNSASTLGVPLVQGSPYDATIDERAQAYRADSNKKYLICSQKANLIEYTRKDICEKIYQVCGIRQFSNNDCRMNKDRGGNDNDDDNDDSNNNGGSTGEKEVGSGSNEGSGYGKDSNNGDDGPQGSGPPGASK